MQNNPFNIAKTYPGDGTISNPGSQIGQKIGLIDATSNYVTDGRFDIGKFSKLHRQLTVVDGYSATVDIEELMRGGVNVVVQAFGPEEEYVRTEPDSDPSVEPPRGSRSWRPYFEGAELVERIEIAIAEHQAFAEAYKDSIEIANDGADILRIVASGKIAMVLMLVSGFIADSIAVLHRFHELGVRVMCPSHLSATSWADSSAELNDPPGLNDFGREVIQACQEIGVLVDLAHCSDYTCKDTLSISTRPMIATHTKARGITNSLRDMPDEILRGVADTGGVICVLAPTGRTQQERHLARLSRDQILTKNYADPFERARAKLANAQVWATKLDLSTIDHVVRVAGIDHVGLSSHAQNVPQWIEFTESLIDHGYNEDDVGKILGGNVVRVLQETIG